MTNLPTDHTFSHLSTIFCTMRSTLSNSGHIPSQVPTGVIAWLRDVGWSGSAIWPSLMACCLSLARSSLSCRFGQVGCSCLSICVRMFNGNGADLFITLMVLCQNRSILHGYRLPRHAICLFRWLHWLIMSRCTSSGTSKPASGTG